MRIFQKNDLKKLYQPANDSSGEDNGQITIIGGSTLFHGAPLLALKTASRIVDMVFFISLEPSLGEVSNKLKSELSSFIWIPWEDAEAYMDKSDAILIGPGMMRYEREVQNLKLKSQNNNSKHISYDGAGNITRTITEKLLKTYPQKKWVIDAGSLQVMETDWIPQKAILTPNSKEFELLFGVEERGSRRVGVVREKAKKHKCTIVAKGPETIVASPEEEVLIRGGNPGLTKGGSGDVLAGLTVALLAKNNPFLAACAASYIEKAASDELYKKVGVNYNMDDLAEKIPEVYRNLLIG